jgi:hypothetical protein
MAEAKPEREKAKAYPYVLLSPQADGLSYQFLGQFDGRSPEQAVEAALAIGGYISVRELEEGKLALGVIAIPASKWYVVQGDGEPRVDWSFSRVEDPSEGEGAEEGERVDVPPKPPAEAPDLAETDEQGLKRL